MNCTYCDKTPIDCMTYGCAPLPTKTFEIKAPKAVLDELADWSAFYDHHADAAFSKAARDEWQSEAFAELSRLASEDPIEDPFVAQIFEESPDAAPRWEYVVDPLQGIADVAKFTVEQATARAQLERLVARLRPEVAASDPGVRAARLARDMADKDATGRGAVFVGGFVYVLADEMRPTWSKIGKTAKTANSRLNAMQTGNPGLSLHAERWFPNHTAVETFMHQKYRQLRVLTAASATEWFHVSVQEATDVLDRIYVLSGVNGHPCNPHRRIK